MTRKCEPHPVAVRTGRGARRSSLRLNGLHLELLKGNNECW